MVILAFLVAGMGIAITKDPPILVLFYTMLAGAIGIILYSAVKDRKAAQRDKRKKKFRK